MFRLLMVQQQYLISESMWVYGLNHQKAPHITPPPCFRVGTTRHTQSFHPFMNIDESRREMRSQLQKSRLASICIDTFSRQSIANKSLFTLTFRHMVHSPYSV